MKKAAVVIGVMAVAATVIAGQRIWRDRIERQRVEARLHELEAAMQTALPAGSSKAKVIEFLDARKVAHETQPGPDQLIAYLGEWQGPLFLRGIHVVFYFDERGGLKRHEAREVEGS